MSSTDENYSENEDTGEIKLQHTVLNTDYLDSGESDTSDGSDEIVFSRERLKSVDENTEENSLVLGELLSEVAISEAVGNIVLFGTSSSIAFTVFPICFPILSKYDLEFCNKFLLDNNDLPTPSDFITFDKMSGIF